jgi:hypothetical protein
MRLRGEGSRIREQERGIGKAWILSTAALPPPQHSCCHKTGVCGSLTQSEANRSRLRDAESQERCQGSEFVNSTLADKGSGDSSLQGE